ncbi:MAG: hypothetical protein E7311_02690 [Clostridiales bacterium]|nr:hypothetical protein [Clostridiales bacterium]
MKKIVFTGGPSAGKSKIIQKLKEYLERLGYQVFIISETSTEIINAGFKWWDNSIETNIYQKLIFKYQLDKENNIITAIEEANMDNVIILLDRGLMDGKAYMDAEDFRNMAKKYAFSETNIYMRYDTVIYLESVSIQFPEIFSDENNKARKSNVNQAKVFDEKVKEIWKKHHDFIEVKAYQTFEEKYENVLKEIKKII